LKLVFAHWKVSAGYWQSDRSECSEGKRKVAAPAPWIGLHHARQVSRCPQIFYMLDRKSTRLNSSHVKISYAVFCLKKKNTPLADRLSNNSCTSEWLTGTTGKLSVL